METRNGHKRAISTREAARTVGRDTLVTKGLRIAFEHPTPDRNDWRCADHSNPRLFDPTTAEELGEAKAYCSLCPARGACLALGVARDEWGVWGGVLLESGKPVDKVRAPGRPKKVPAAAGAA